MTEKLPKKKGSASFTAEEIRKGKQEEKESGQRRTINI